MPRIKRFAGAAAIAIVMAAMPAAAEPRDRDGNEGYSEQRSGKAWKKRYSKYEKQKRLRYAQRRYYYPWTRWWGPFAGPPGL